jgi:hypothetical protein
VHLPPLGPLVAQLFVGDGHSGRREARLQLAEDLLPGVTVAVFEERGDCVAEFVCSDERSRTTLSNGAEVMAQELANRLGRSAVWRVMTDDNEDLRLVEARAVSR